MLRGMVMTRRPASHRGTRNSTLGDVLNQTPTYRCLWKARREVFSGTSSNGDLEGYVDGVGRAKPQKKKKKQMGIRDPPGRCVTDPSTGV